MTRVMSAIVSFVLIGVVALIGGTSTATAQTCPQWMFPIDFKIEQTNGITVSFHLAQNGVQLTGGAMHPRHVPRTLTISGYTYEISGTADGTLRGNAFEVTVYWGRGQAIGVYSGTVNPQGRLSGNTFDKRNPSSRADWFGPSLLKCRSTGGKTGAGNAQPKSPISEPKRDLGQVQISKIAKAPPQAIVAPLCRSGFVWRAARPSDYVCVPPAGHARVAAENKAAATQQSRNRCGTGFVFREAFSGDRVCVTPQSRAAAREENRLGPSRTQTGSNTKSRPDVLVK